MPKIIDLTGKRFGKLTVLEFDGIKDHSAWWTCRCDCGSIKSVNGVHLRDGRVKSCGCAKKDRFVQMKHTPYTEIHKQYHRIYMIWRGMFSRCYNPKHKQYRNYGGRGIRICEEWHGDEGFVSFLNWSLSNGYQDNLEIDRINNSREYCPDNCRWITHKQQQNNRSNNRYITYNGETKTLSEWCEQYGLRFPILKHRIDVLQLPFEVAVSMVGLAKVTYKGKEISIRRLAQIQRIDYKSLLHAVLVDHEDVEHAVDRLLIESA